VSVVSRLLAAVAAVAGIVLGLAGLVRTAALAADDDVVWESPRWWADLVDGPASWAVAVAAGGVAAAAVLYLIVAFRQFDGSSVPATARIGDVDVKLAALERLVGQRLAAEVAGLAPVRVRVSWAGEGWDVVALVDARPLGLDGVRARAVDVAEAELIRATGRGLERLSLEVRRFRGSGSTAAKVPGQKKGLGFTRPL
jgi:hypothetical protein